MPAMSWTTSAANCCPLDKAIQAGVSRDRIASSGLGFAKTGDHNWTLSPVCEIVDLGTRSRRSSQGVSSSPLADPTTGEDRPPDGRDAARRSCPLIAGRCLGCCGCTRFRFPGRRQKLAARWETRQRKP
jgi:hypothetical protein